MDTSNLQSNQQSDLQTAQSAIQQTPQQSPAATVRNKNQNKPMLVAAALSTAIGYILVNFISTILINYISPYIRQQFTEMYSYLGSEILSYLSSIISFLIYAVIVVISAAISCKKAKDGLIFFVCCISAYAIIPFISNAIMTVISSVCYLKDIDIYSNYYYMVLRILYLCAVIVSVFVAFILRYITSQKTQTASFADSVAQGEASQTV